MSNEKINECPFNGEWEVNDTGHAYVIAGENGSSGNIIVVSRSGNASYQGYFVHYAAPVINFKGIDGPVTGVLSVKETERDHILWSDGKQWVRNTCG